MSAALPAGLRLESLEVGASPLVLHFLSRLDLPGLFGRHLPPLPGRAPGVPSGVVLALLVQNFLLARQPLYAIPAWTQRRVPEHLGLSAEQVLILNDDRLGRALDHLYRADRASLLCALVRRAVKEFSIDLGEFHQDTTTVTFTGEYRDQAPAFEKDRPPLITFGHNKDHRPDLKQLLYGLTISADGAVPVHCKVWDGNTTDDCVHIETWDFLHELAGSADFLYVADCKLCSRDNMHHIDSRNGRFLTVMPRTRKEDRLFKEHLVNNPMEWCEVHREPNPRRKGGPDQVYKGVEAPWLSCEGYRVLWYRSSQKAEQDAEDRRKRLERARQRLAALAAKKEFDTPKQAQEAGQRIIDEAETQGLLLVKTKGRMEELFKQIGPGRPGPDTKYERIEKWTWEVDIKEDAEALRKAALTDGVFPLMTNDKGLSLKEALEKYKYQPFVEKRHEQLKSVFSVAPVWLKSPSRVETLLFVYHVVEMVQALVEREVRRRMEAGLIESLALYPEGRPSAGPTANLLFCALEGLRRHRLLDEQGQELRRFHDTLPEAARHALELLEVSLAPFGLD
jgi:transposase